MCIYIYICLLRYPEKVTIHTYIFWLLEFGEYETSALRSISSEINYNPPAAPRNILFSFDSCISDRRVTEDWKLRC